MLGRINSRAESETRATLVSALLTASNSRFEPGLPRDQPQKTDAGKHVVDGVGDLMGLVREDLPHRGSSKKMASLAGPGESDYTRYDRNIAAAAVR